MLVNPSVIAESLASLSGMKGDAVDSDYCANSYYS